MFKIFLICICLWIIACVYLAVCDINSFNNPEICQFTGSFDVILNRNKNPEYHFEDVNGNSYVLFATDTAVKEMNGEALEKGRIYIIHFEKNSHKIVAVEEVID